MTKKFLIITIVLYLVTRLASPLLLAPFHDEVIYIFLGKQFGLNPLSNWNINFVDGKEPLFFWVMGLFQLIIPEPLVAGRVMAALLGLVGLLVFYKLALKLLAPRGVMIALVAYLVSPFLLMYQRLALIEGLLTTLLIFAFYRLICFCEEPNRRSAILLGLSFGLSALTKTNSLLFLLALLPLLLYKKGLNIKYLAIALGAFILSCGWLFILPQYQLIATKNKVFSLTPGEFLSSPFVLFKSHIRLTYSWLESFIGLPAMLASLLVILAVKKQRVLVIGLTVATIFPIAVEMAIAKQFFPRYFLFSLIPFLLLLSLGLQRIKNKLALVTILFVIFIPQAILSKQIITDPINSSLHPTEKWQFIYSWPAGYGWQEVFSYLQSVNPKLVIAEDIWGVVYSQEYYLPNRSYPLITRNYHNYSELDNANFVNTIDKDGSIFIFTQRQDIPLEWNLEKIKTVYRPGNTEAITLWQVKK